MMELVSIGLTLGFIAGFSNNKAMKRGLDSPLTFLEFVIPTASIIFIVYSFTHGIGFGLMAIVEIMAGAFMGKKTMDWYERS